MFSLFPRASFCAECGIERSDPDHTWRRLWTMISHHRFLCSDCSIRLRIGRRRIVFATIASAVGIFSVKYLRRKPAQGPAVSSWDANALPIRERTRGERPIREQCGARTKKGTPCRRLAPPGERCAQHRGRESILPKTTASPVKQLRAE